MSLVVIKHQDTVVRSKELGVGMKKRCRDFQQNRNYLP